MTKQTTPHSNYWLKIASAYLDLGWSIIPVGSSKKPLVKWKEFQTRHASMDEVKQWLSFTDFSGFAVVTGQISSITVLDIDQGSDFDVTTLPKTPFATTPSSGLHYYFKSNDKYLSNATGFVKNTDFRANGGYAILPPTTGEKGKYEWELSPRKQPLADLPDHLSSLLHSGDQKRSVIDLFPGVEQSQRNDSAAKVIGSLISKYPDAEWETAVWPLVIAWNDKNAPPLPHAELRSVFDSIISREKVKLSSQSDDKKKNQAQLIIEMVQDHGVKIFTNQFRECCIAIPESPFIAHKLRSRHTKNYLYRLFHKVEGKPPYSEAVNTAISTLESYAYFGKESHQVNNRVGRKGDSIYYDLGDNKHVIKVNSNGWKIQTHAPVYFHRYAHQKKQVVPAQGGSLSDFLTFTNVANPQQELLLLTYLVVCLIPDIPRAMLLVHGDQGSAKSTLMKFIRSLIDPSHVPLLTPPESPKELVQFASHNYALMLDNLTSMPTWLSDAMCRVITGDGFSKRQLFTDDEDVLYAYKRASAISGITQVSDKPDLLDRSLLLELNRIPDTKRLDERSLWLEFNQKKPAIFGAMLDALSATLVNHSKADPKKKPRMADYYRYCLATAMELGFSENSLFAAFEHNTFTQNEEAIEQSAVAQALIDFMQERNSYFGTSSQLHADLYERAKKIGLGKSFPKSSKWLWRKIVEVRPNLLAIGFTFQKVRKNNANFIQISKTVSTDSSVDTPDNKNVGNIQASGNSDNSGNKKDTFTETVVATLFDTTP